MANDKNFKIKNGLQAGRYLQTGGTETAGSEGYNLGGGSYDSKSFDAAAQDTSAMGLFIKPDGTKFYQVGADNDTVYQYSMSTAWDISTASYDSKSFSVTSQDTTPYGVFFKSDGLTMYVLGRVNGSIYQYTLSTAWDVSTASYASKSLSLTGQVALPVTGLFFSSDGTFCYAMDSSSTSSDIYQYTLSTAWDVSTGSYASKTFAIDDGLVASLFFSVDGTKVFYNNYSDDRVEELSLSTAWDISTASKTGVTLDVSSQSTTNWNLFFKTDGSKLYINYATGGNNTIYQYSTVSLTQTLDLSTGHYFNSALSGNTIIELSNPPASGVAYAAQIEVTGNSSIVVNDISDATYDSKSFSVSGQLANDSLAFKTDGTKMYCLNQGTRVGHQYSLSTPWDISTASYDSVTGSFTGQTSSPSGLKLSSDGTKCFVLDSVVITDRIYQYTLSTAWDLSSVSYDSVSLSVNGLDTDGTGFCFNSDGTELYYMGQATETIYQYSLSTAWDLSTADYYSSSRSFSFAAQTAECRNVIINLDGTKMYIVEEGNSDFVHQYTLSTAFDVSTASYDSDNFSLSSQETEPRDIEFNNDFTKMYALGQSNSTVFQYTTGSNNPHVLTWPDSIKWDLGAAAPSPDPGSKDMYALLTIDGGTTYYGKGTGENIS